LLALLWERDQKDLYVPGLTVDRVRDAYHEESKPGPYKGMVAKGRSPSERLDPDPLRSA
jgi:hypothetical protein